MGIVNNGQLIVQNKLKQISSVNLLLFINFDMVSEQNCFRVSGKLGNFCFPPGWQPWIDSLLLHQDTFLMSDSGTNSSYWSLYISYDVSLEKFDVHQGNSCEVTIFFTLLSCAFAVVLIF